MNIWQPMAQARRSPWMRALLAVALLTLLTTGAALAAEFSNQDIYRLPADGVVNDDLYLLAGEVYIDGIVRGDLYVAAGYVEINGTVEGDLVAAAGSVVIRGTVVDDVRVAAGGVEVSGNVGDDLLIAAGGGPNTFAFPMQQPSVPQGVRIAQSAIVGGDLYLMAGGGTVNGTIAGDLSAVLAELTLGAQVGGDANLIAENLRITPESRIAGSLTYTAPERLSGLDQNAESVFYRAAETQEVRVSPVQGILGWLARTIALLIGFAGLSWLVLRFAPQSLIRPVASLNDAPVESGIYGLVAGALLIFVPILSTVLVVIMAVFWGIFPAFVLFTFLFGGLALLWFFSPLITGLWLGQRIVGTSSQERSLLVTLLLGLALIVLLGRVPILGWLIYLISFVLAFGGLLRSMRRPQTPDGPTEPAPLSPVPAAEG